MHILQETQTEPSLQATQLRLKRARLADNLNEKIAQRPGPMELVEKNILPVASASEDAPGGGEEEELVKPADVYTFNEDSSEAFSAPQAAHQQPASSTSTSTSTSTSSATSTSPREPGEDDATSAASRTSRSTQRSLSPLTQAAPDPPSLASTPPKAPAPQPSAAAAPCGSVLVKQSLSKLSGDKSRSKRSKEPKPRVKKLKYHQYIPPDRKQALSEVQMDSAYARLLQQQQQFLQLQILRQQQFNFQPSPAANANRPAAEAQTSCSSIVLPAAAAPPHVQPQQGQSNWRPDHLPANLDELKVAELKMELKLRSLPVSGTKTDLIERLKLYQETSSLQPAEKTVAPEAAPPEHATFSPPVSPIASRVSSLGIEDRGVADGPPRLPDTASPPPAAGSVPEESPVETRPPEKDSEKDKRLHEKERQIEELMRKLEQEQRLVEELKMQLEVEKRSLQGDSPAHLSPLQVKEEASPGACSSPALLIKQEPAEDPCTPGLRSQLALSQRPPQQQQQHEAEQPTEGAHLLLAPPFPTTTIQLPASSIILHSPESSGGLGLLPSPAPNTEASPQQRGGPPHAWGVDSTTATFLSTFPAGGRPAGASSGQAGNTDPANVSVHPSQPAFRQPAKFPNQVCKSKDPPCYEDAVKQTRTLQSAAQGPTAASQQMDDLFDVLIKSGEISPFIREDSTGPEAPLPVTASVTTLPISTALSRPPPLVLVAQLPAAPALADLSRSDSPVVTMEMDFNASPLPSSLNLHSASMDNMDWLDLNLSAEGVGSLDMAAPAGVFSDFLDPQELQLSWD